MSKVRDNYFDNAKFILILLVVFGHSITSLKSDTHIISTIYTFIFIFHMPAFILISGYFSKRFNKPGYHKKLIKKTIIPYLIFQVIYSGFYYITGYEDQFSFDLLSPHWTLWFLISLLSWQLILPLFSRFGVYGFPLAVLIGIFAGYLNEIGTFLSFSRTFAFFPLFYLGYLLKKEHFKILKKPKIKYPSLIVLIVIFSISYFFFPDDIQPWLLNSSSYQSLGVSSWLGGFIRLSLYALTLLTTFSFLALIPSQHWSFTTLGEKTLYIYLLHGFFIKIAALLPLYEKIQNIYSYSVLFIGSILLCYILASRPVRTFMRPLVEVRMPKLLRNVLH
ncbi:acyltransferase family protein [Terrilactibacillus laevilacticus]|uniref:Acyltransferase family protein n=1 Tax=Terrilactibacillus laevilacticus TaxID=1380157 RepID=A0ABW5PPI1_9BACI|nr:acyltransferase family protein [Terrilactibacillus laevilacticus]